MDIRPHPGPQETFLSTPADIAIYGGQAGGGKTWALLIEALRHINNPGYGAVIFRRTSPQIRREGGLWDESINLYGKFRAHPRESTLEWLFETGAKISFAAMEHEGDRFDWDGSQIPLIGFDQLEHFTALQFFYMLSRNRSTCGVAPYIRATANPDPDSWLAEFLEWWIDQSTGYPIEKRGGVLRYFVRFGEELIWGDSRDEVYQELYKRSHDKSASEELAKFALTVTFIPASVDDNPTMLEKDPAYKAKLAALPLVERERLMKGNWKVKAGAGMYFRRDYFTIYNKLPGKPVKTRRYWDLAATEKKKKENNNPDFTVGVKMSLLDSGLYIVENVVRFRKNPSEVERKMLAHAQIDGAKCFVRFSKDPGQAGVAQANALIRKLAHYNPRAIRESGDKIVRASPFSAQCEHGNVGLLRGSWNEAYLLELENFPDGNFDDQVDASSGAYNDLSGALKAGTWGRGKKDAA